MVFMTMVYAILDRIEVNESKRERESYGEAHWLGSLLFLLRHVLILSIRKERERERENGFGLGGCMVGFLALGEGPVGAHFIYLS